MIAFFLGPYFLYPVFFILYCKILNIIHDNGWWRGIVARVVHRMNEVILPWDWWDLDG